MISNLLQSQTLQCYISLWIPRAQYQLQPLPDHSKVRKDGSEYPFSFTS